MCVLIDGVIVICIVIECCCFIFIFDGGFNLYLKDMKNFKYLNKGFICFVIDFFIKMKLFVC